MNSYLYIRGTALWSLVCRTTTKNIEGFHKPPRAVKTQVRGATWVSMLPDTGHKEQTDAHSNQDHHTPPGGRIPQRPLGI